MAYIDVNACSKFRGQQYAFLLSENAHPTMNAKCHERKGVRSHMDIVGKMCWGVLLHRHIMFNEAILQPEELNNLLLFFKPQYTWIQIISLNSGMKWCLVMRKDIWQASRMERDWDIMGNAARLSNKERNKL